jgi:glutathione S-transferase
MDILAQSPLEVVPEDVEADVRRIVALWRECRTDFGKGGPFLFGAFTAADAMFAPVASRFRTYLPDLAKFGDDGTAAAYVDTVFAMPEVHSWVEGAKAEGAVAP